MFLAKGGVWASDKSLIHALHWIAKGVILKIKYLTDVNSDKNGNHIIMLNSCFIVSHLKFL